jgi:YidC/Oxa1 family membrane protein insertase
MDNQRLFLFVALSFVVLLMWQAWLKDYGPAQQESHPTAPAVQQPATATAPEEELPPASAVPAAKESSVPEQITLPAGQQVEVKTDILDVVINTAGGGIRRTDLLDYRVSTTPGSAPLRLLNDTMPDLFIVQSGLRTPDGVEPTHHVEYHAEQTHYQLAAGADSLQVPLHWRSPKGVEVTKLYTFHRDSYVVDLDFQVHNGSAADWHGRAYRQLQRSEPPAPSGHSKFIHTYTGGVIYSPEDKYQKISFKDMSKSPLDRVITGGWAGMSQHYFLAALIPARNEADRYYTKALSDERFVIGMISPQETVPAGGSATFHTRLYAGPKLQDHLADVAPGLELTVDYGRLTVLAQPIFWLLKTIHKAIGNWGWSIVLLTMLIKLAFYKLSETSYRSMANMRKLAPRLKSLKERYGDDRQRLNQAMMELYKKEKINPLGGCLPIVVQIPVFIALYWVLLESVEMRQAPFMLWLNNLSAPDPYYVLPLLMGATMLIQQKLNPAPMDPIQAKVMMALPIVFTVFFAFFPSGLVLYWVVNNTLSIAQQYVITRRIERGAKK